MKLILRFIQLSGFEKKLFIEAVFFIFYSKILISIYPFQTSIKRFKPCEQLNKSSDFKVLEHIKIAISRASKLVFWKNICLVNSFAARNMLQRRKIRSVMYLGLQFESCKEMKAHAWLMVGNIYITPRGEEGYKEIYRF